MNYSNFDDTVYKCVFKREKKMAMGAKSSLSGGACVYVPCNETHRDDSKAGLCIIVVVGVTVGQYRGIERREEKKNFTPKMPKFKVHSQYLYIPKYMNRLVGNFYPSIVCIAQNPSIIISSEGKKSINCVTCRFCVASLYYFASVITLFLHNLLYALYIYKFFSFFIFLLKLQFCSCSLLLLLLLLITFGPFTAEKLSNCIAQNRCYLQHRNREHFSIIILHFSLLYRPFVISNSLNSSNFCLLTNQ